MTVPILWMKKWRSREVIELNHAQQIEHSGGCILSTHHRLTEGAWALSLIHALLLLTCITWDLNFFICITTWLSQPICKVPSSFQSLCC